MYLLSEILIINIKNNLHEATSLMNSIFYNYFLESYGCKNAILQEEIDLKERYKNLSKNDLKKQSKALNYNNIFINTINYIAEKIRSIIVKYSTSIIVATDNDDEMNRNFWGYSKKVFRSGTSVLPSFEAV